MIDNNTQKSNTKKTDNRQYVTHFYTFLSIIAVIIMVVAAYITYGYQKREVFISFDQPEKEEKKVVNNIVVTPDVSRVPSDDVIEDLLNDELPEVCDECDDDTLDCIEDYEINKIFVQNEGYQDQLIVDVITGKNDAKYTVVIDLNNNTVLSSSGEIDGKECFEDVEDEEINSEMLIDPGNDPESSHYLYVPDTIGD